MESRAVDVHAHAMPMPLLRRLADRGLADLGEVDDGTLKLDSRVSGIGPWAPLPLALSQHDVPTRLAEMDEVGVSRHAVSLPPFLFCSTADDGDLVADIVRQGNDALAAYVAAAPDRLVGLGTVPVGWPGAVAEVRRCLDDLGMPGVAIGTRGGGHDLDDPVNAELWALLAERGTFIFMHPSGVPDAHRQRDFYLAQLTGYPMETALTVARLVFSGTLERFELNLCLAHGGGCLPALRGRLDLGWERKSVAHTTSVPPSRITSRLFYDTATFSTTLLGRLVEDVGADHVLLGTDHPFELGDRAPLATVHNLGLDAAPTRAILWDTAAALLKLA